MLDEILQDTELFALCRGECFENDICIEFDELLAEDRFLILKTDAYYSSSRMHNPPPSLDCLIVVECETTPCYDFYLIEMKDISSPSGFEIENIRQKFATVIEDFLKNRFGHIFSNPTYCLNKFRLYFVSDACRIKKKFRGITQEAYRKKILGTKYEAFLSLKPFEFRGKKALIDPRLPNPMVEVC
ncbi:hypothetical protein QUF80_01155 [Desulfococcaceae bacterium HSG8]|nr:hypothetical protein [Desulfococcaceae bacterium HSG8]